VQQRTSRRCRARNHGHSPGIEAVPARCQAHAPRCSLAVVTRCRSAAAIFLPTAGPGLDQGKAAGRLRSPRARALELELKDGRAAQVDVRTSSRKRPTRGRKGRHSRTNHVLDRPNPPPGIPSQIGEDVGRAVLRANAWAQTLQIGASPWVFPPG